jgi:membrane protease YdiL (CAAX protease family)
METSATRTAMAPAGALGAAAFALGVALLVPRLFSDPAGVDPFDVRVAAASLAVLGAAFASARLAATRPVLVSVAAIAAPFCLWAATPSVLADLFGDRFSGNARVLGADIVYMAATLAFAAAVRRSGLPLRLRKPGVMAVAVAAGGIVVLLGTAMALPAPLLGRDAIQPVAVSRDLPWIGPAFALQAAAQEVQFRGLLLGALEHGLPRNFANLIQAAFFGLAHIAVQYEGPAGPFVPLTIALGLALGYVTQHTGSVWPAIAIHAALEVAAAVGVVSGLYGY